jgi:hemerythrin-like domain-containing protein
MATIDADSASGFGPREIRPAVEVALSGPFMARIDIGRTHAANLQLCGMLESIADQLPGEVDRLQCLALASSMLVLLRECHRFEEEVVFPAFARAVGSQAVVSRLQAEHVEDYCAAEDLSEILLSLSRGQPIGNPEAFGYMLRALFESMRRHIAFERDHVLPRLGDVA